MTNTADTNQGRDCEASRDLTILVLTDVLYCIAIVAVLWRMWFV